RRTGREEDKGNHGGVTTATEGARSASEGAVPPRLRFGLPLSTPDEEPHARAQRNLPEVTHQPRDRSAARGRRQQQSGVRAEPPDALAQRAALEEVPREVR